MTFIVLLVDQIFLIVLEFLGRSPNSLRWLCMAFVSGEPRDVANVMSNLPTRQDDLNRGMPSPLIYFWCAPCSMSRDAKACRRQRIGHCDHAQTRLAKWGYGEIILLTIGSGRHRMQTAESHVSLAAKIVELRRRGNGASVEPSRDRSIADR